MQWVTTEKICTWSADFPLDSDGYLIPYDAEETPVGLKQISVRGQNPNSTTEPENGAIHFMLKTVFNVYGENQRRKPVEYFKRVD